MKTNGTPWRSLKDVSEDELLKAVTKMCNELGIYISGNSYSVFEAVLKERDQLFTKAAVLENAVNHR